MRIKTSLPVLGRHAVVTESDDGTIRIHCPTGCLVFAVFDGTVTASMPELVLHSLNGEVFAHYRGLDEERPVVQPGDVVAAGEPIGQAGTEQCSLDLTVRRSDEVALEPLKLLVEATDPAAMRPIGEWVNSASSNGTNERRNSPSPASTSDRFQAKTVDQSPNAVEQPGDDTTEPVSEPIASEVETPPTTPTRDPATTSGEEAPPIDSSPPTVERDDVAGHRLAARRPRPQRRRRP